MGGDVIRGWTHPILIPYYDWNGRLVAIRPHKDQPVGLRPRVYCAGAGSTPPARLRFKQVVITEGEFKAGAILQVLGSAGWGALSVPGISMPRNFFVWEELLTWLKRLGAYEVVVGFDREVKAPKTTADGQPAKVRRHDAQVYARYTAQALAREGYYARVALLPTEWMDAAGKADWDGALARMLAEGKSEDEVRTEFARVLGAALKPGEIRKANWFSAAEEQVIQDGVARLFYSPELPHGGEREYGLALKLRKLARGALKDVSGVESLAKAYLEVKGWYYTLTPLSDKRADTLAKDMAKAQKAGDDTALWFYRLKAQGIPTRVADFRMDLHFVLARTDGKRERWVTLTNTQGERSEIVNLDSRSFVRPSDFREWLGNKGNFTWMKGERELQALQRDKNREGAFMDVQQVVAFGEHEETGLYFFDDCAFGPAGEVLLPDAHGNFWWRERGYRVTELGKENQDFRLGRPRMFPGQTLGYDADGNYTLVETDGAKPLGDALRPFFCDLMHRLREALGGCDAMIGMGAFAAYMAASWMMTRFKGFPGLWVHGEQGQGKTSLIQWLMEVWGFRNLTSGIGLLSANCTPVGLQIVAEQYSNLPAWLDEYRTREVGPDKRAIIHCAFNREPPSKWSATGEMRKIRTAFVVTGESTSSDAATRSRYPHFQVAENRRTGNHFGWMQENRHLFFLIGRELLLRRSEFCGLFSDFLERWKGLDDVKGLHERPKLVHGVSWAGYMALGHMMRSERPAELDAFRLHAAAACTRNAEEVKAEVNVNVFWQDFVSCWKMGGFGHSRHELERFFRVRERPLSNPPGAPNQGRWTNYWLFIEPNSVKDAMERYLTQMRRTMALDKGDLRAQMSRHEYFVGAEFSQRFGVSGGVMRCWAIDLDRHEMGYNRVSDEALDESRRNPENPDLYLESSAWADPRKGPLIGLAEWMVKGPEEGDGRGE